jgi:hypothetical protein
MTNLDQWVSAEFQNLAQVIYDYDNYLEFQMVPLSEHHTLLDKSKVFRIVDTRTNNIVLYADSLTNPREILTRLFMMDQKNGDVLAILDAQNAAAEALKNEKIIAEQEARKDFVAFVMNNTKSRWTHEGHAFDDEFRDLGPVSKTIT